MLYTTSVKADLLCSGKQDDGHPIFIFSFVSVTVTDETWTSKVRILYGDRL
jgi:hypothetical protein